jgi:hypothetical protein
MLVPARRETFLVTQYIVPRWQWGRGASSFVPRTVPSVLRDDVSGERSIPPLPGAPRPFAATKKNKICLKNIFIVQRKK